MYTAYTGRVAKHEATASFEENKHIQSVFMICSIYRSADSMALNETAAPLKIPASFKGQFTGIVMKTWHPAALEVGGACVHIDDE